MPGVRGESVGAVFGGEEENVSVWVNRALRQCLFCGSTNERLINYDAAYCAKCGHIWFGKILDEIEQRLISAGWLPPCEGRKIREVMKKAIDLSYEEEYAPGERLEGIRDNLRLILGRLPEKEGGG